MPRLTRARFVVNALTVQERVRSLNTRCERVITAKTPAGSTLYLTGLPAGAFKMQEDPGKALRLGDRGIVGVCLRVAARHWRELKEWSVLEL